MRSICLLALCLSASALKVQKPQKEQVQEDEISLLSTNLAEEGKPVRQRLKSDEGMAYYGTLHVGGQPQLSIYDTGSFDLVLESQCTLKEEKFEEKADKKFEHPKKEKKKAPKKNKKTEHGKKNKKHSLAEQESEESEDPEDLSGLTSMSNEDLAKIFGNMGGDSPFGQKAAPKQKRKGTHCCRRAQCPNAKYNKMTSGSNYEEETNVELEEIVYGSGPVTVRPGFDHVAIKDEKMIGKGSAIEAGKMPVKVIVDHDVELFKQTDMQAIVGIGPGDWADRKNRMYHRLGVKRFMVCFQEDAKEDGYMTWNDKDRSKDETWMTVPVPGQVFWALPTSDFKMIGAAGFLGLHFDAKVGCQPSCGGIIDTGTSLITPPPDVVNAIQTSLENGDIEDCSDLSKFPTFEFKLNGKTLSLPPQSYIGDAGYTEVFLKHRFLSLPTLPMTKQDAKIVKKARALKQKGGEQTETKVRSCVLLLSPNDEPEETQYGPMVIFGMSLFRKYAVQFDLSADVTEGSKKHTAKDPQRFMHFSEASSDCEGTKDGKKFARFKRTGKKSNLQSVQLDKIRISPLQQRVLPKRSNEPKGNKMRRKGILRI